MNKEQFSIVDSLALIDYEKGKLVDVILNGNGTQDDFERCQQLDEVYYALLAILSS